jgi:hypothetical protein
MVWLTTASKKTIIHEDSKDTETGMAIFIDELRSSAPIWTLFIPQRPLGNLKIERPWFGLSFILPISGNNAPRPVMDLPTPSSGVYMDTIMIAYTVAKEAPNDKAFLQDYLSKEKY